MGAVRVAYTLEQCWHDVPGGTAVAAIEVARRLARVTTSSWSASPAGTAARRRGVAAADPGRPAPAAAPAALRGVAAAAPARRRAGHRPGRRRPRHRPRAVPLGAPLVVTMHDLAFVHQPDRFTRQGLRVMRRSLAVTRDAATLVVTSSDASRRDLEANGIEAAAHPRRAARRRPRAGAGRRRRRGPPDLRAAGALRAVRRHARAAQEPAPARRGDGPARRPDAARRRRSRRVGRRPPTGSTPPTSGSSASSRPPTCPALYAAATVFAYPSESEGFGLPVAEAMAQGTPVVTSAGTSTEEVAGGAAVLVDPFDVDAIAAGIDDGPAPGRRAGGRRPGPSRGADVGRRGRADARRVPRGRRWSP